MCLQKGISHILVPIRDLRGGKWPREDAFSCRQRLEEQMKGSGSGPTGSPGSRANPSRASLSVELHLSSLARKREVILHQVLIAKW